MESDKKLLQQIITDYKGDDLAGHLAEVLKTIEQTKAALRQYQYAVRQADLAHKKTIEELKATLREVQAKCKHLSSTYHGDPSGGSDSFYRCNHCDKTW